MQQPAVVRRETAPLLRGPAATIGSVRNVSYGAKLGRRLHMRVYKAATHRCHGYGTGRLFCHLMISRVVMLMAAK